MDKPLLLAAFYWWERPQLLPPGVRTNIHQPANADRTDPDVDEAVRAAAAVRAEATTGPPEGELTPL